MGETVACSVRVPVENVKQNQQAGKIDARLLSGASQILRESGVGGFYRGFSATVGREVPFAMIQMPLLESAKRAWRGYRGADLEPYHVALCGCASGGFAAAVTTPLDVVKTRLMLGADAKGVAYEGETRWSADLFSVYLSCTMRLGYLGQGLPHLQFSFNRLRVAWPPATR